MCVCGVFGLGKGGSPRPEGWFVILVTADLQ